MKVDYLDENPDIDLEAFSSSGLPRTPGLHLTDLITRLESLYDKPRKEDGMWDLPLAGGCGFLWEDLLSRALSTRIGYRPEEQVLVHPDTPHITIPCSPDGICPDPLGLHPYAVSETKFTWRSSNHPIEYFTRWLYQTKAYCQSLLTPVTVFRILHVNGDYKSVRPVFRTVRVEYDEPEILSAVRLLFQMLDRR